LGKTLIQVIHSSFHLYNLNIGAGPSHHTAHVGGNQLGFRRQQTTSGEADIYLTYLMIITDYATPCVSVDVMDINPRGPTSMKNYK
jgi:hypothetical protein